MRETINLKGITKKGKQRIQEHGALWEVLEKRPGTFEGLLLGSPKTGNIRWLTTDFEVMNENKHVVDIDGATD